MRSVNDLPVLYLGCLLHDIGKGRGGDHANEGAKLAWGCLERLGLTRERVARAVFIVRHHLLMPHVAQRRDLSDPKVIVDFARVVGDRENLRNLYLATYADMRASSPSAWNEWKGASLAELFERTSEFLESGRDDPHRAVEQMEAHIESRREEAKREIRSLGIAESRVDAYFEMMPRRYFVAHTARQIAQHARVVLSFAPDQTHRHIRPRDVRRTQHPHPVCPGPARPVRERGGLSDGGGNQHPGIPGVHHAGGNGAGDLPVVDTPRERSGEARGLGEAGPHPEGRAVGTPRAGRNGPSPETTDRTQASPLPAGLPASASPTRSRTSIPSSIFRRTIGWVCSTI